MTTDTERLFPDRPQGWTEIEGTDPDAFTAEPHEWDDWPEPPLREQWMVWGMSHVRMAAFFYVLTHLALFGGMYGALAIQGVTQTAITGILKAEGAAVLVALFAAAVGAVMELRNGIHPAWRKAS